MTTITLTPVNPEVPPNGYVFQDMSNVDPADLLAAGVDAGLAVAADVAEADLSNVSGANMLSKGVASGLKAITPTTASSVIASGIATVTNGVVLLTVDTEGAAASDDLTDITGGTTGQILVLRTTTAARVVTVKDTTAINLPGGDFVMNSTSDTCTLIYTGSRWAAIATANNA